MSNRPERAAAVRPLLFPSLAVEHPRLAPETIAVPAGAPALRPEEIEALRERARAAGFEAGIRDGQALACAEWGDRLGEAARALDEAARALLASRVRLAAEVERQLPKLVLALTRKILHLELSHAETATQTVIRGVCVRLAGCDTAVVVRLAPAMVEAFEAWRRTDDGARQVGPGIRVEADPDLRPGDFLVQTEDGFLDGRVQSQLDEAWRLITELPQ